MIVGKEAIPTEDVLAAMANVYARAYAANIGNNTFQYKAETAARDAMKNFYQEAVELLK